MLGSDYRELIVPRAGQEEKSKFILIGGIVAVGALVALFFVTNSIITLLLAAAAGFGTWFLRSRSQIEYEYVIFGDEFRVTKIIAQTKRSEMLTCSLKTFTAFGSLAEAPQLSASQTLVLACTAQDHTAYFADFDHEQYGQTRLLFTPDASILDYLSKHMPRTIGFRYTMPEEFRDSEV